MFNRLPRGLLILFLLIAALAAGFGVTVEQRFGEQLASVSADPPERDPQGRKVYILMVDSLSVSNADEMPAFSRIGEQGFRMELQPCFDNFTTACVREMLTGRRVFSLFAVLENLQVTRPGVGDNIMADAKRAGMSTALLSWGDLRGWSKLVDTDHRFKKGQRDEEAEIGLKVAAEHDLVFHHWIWHDIASHHHAKKKGPKYAESLQRTDELIATISEGLPPGMDLIVTGDHGHASDGRHVQGMDVPTVLVARSSNLNPMVVDERIPITAVRFIIGAITGVGSHASQVRPEWRGWLSDSVGPELRSLGSGQGASDGQSTLPLGPLVATAALVLVGCWAMGWKVGLAVAAWMALAGFFFPAWLEFSHVRGFRKPIMAIAWSIPVLAGLTALLRTRSLASGWLGAAYGSVALSLVLWPGLFVTGVLRNSDGLLVPIVVMAGLVALNGQRNRDESTAWSTWGLGALCVGAVALAIVITDFNTNHFRIRRFPALWAFKEYGELKIVASVALGVAVHRLLDSDVRWAPVGGLAVVLGPHMPTAMAAVSVLGFSAVWWLRPSAWRSRALSVLAIAITGHTLSSKRQLGVLLTVVGVGVAIHVIRMAADRLPEAMAGRVIRLSAAVVLLIAGFIGLAWTTKLQVSGVDFTFAVDWLPGRLHKDLWWVVAAATVLNCFLPLLLAIEIAWERLGSAVSAAADLAARLCMLRFVGTTVFATAWMIPMGDAAASARLRSFLQDGFIWLILGGVMVGVSFLRRPKPTVDPNAASADAQSA